jgi:2,6-dihydroxypyridine 3-monooxygenase
VTARAVVMGGSLGGLNAALFLRAAGLEVDVYERSPAPLVGQGAGIVLNPATLRYLVENEVSDLGAVSLATGVLRYLDHEGRTVAEHPEPYRFTSYDALYRTLLGAFDADRYHLGEEVVHFAQDGDRVGVRLASGVETNADLLVCADGIRSSARSRLVPDRRPRYAGYVAWRGTAAPAALSSETSRLLREAITYGILRHGHCLSYPIPGPGSAADGGYLFNWLWYRNVPEGSDLAAVMTDREGRRRDISLPAGGVSEERVRRLREDAASALPPQIAELVAATDRPFIQAVFDADVPRMAFGRVCLIGDAAFACRPHAAAGSAKAAEDAYRLGTALRAARGDIGEALRAWEPGQIRLGQSVLERTRAAGQRSQVDCTWRVGEPLPFGLYEAGDSIMALSSEVGRPRTPSTG